MATGTILLPVGAAVPSDGSASNAAPAISRVKGSETAPAKHVLVADFDATTDEHLTYTFIMPQDYSSGGTLRINWGAVTGTSGSVRWKAQVGAVTAADADTPNEHAQAAVASVGTAANATEAGRLVQSTITLTMDSAAAGDHVFLVFGRDADGTSGTDDTTGDARLWGLAFEYTTT